MSRRSRCGAAGAWEPDAAMGDLGYVCNLSSVPQAQLQAAESALHRAACPQTHRKLLCKVTVLSLKKSSRSFSLPNAGQSLLGHVPHLHSLRPGCLAGCLASRAAHSTNSRPRPRQSVESDYCRESIHGTAAPRLLQSQLCQHPEILPHWHATGAALGEGLCPSS